MEVLQRPPTGAIPDAPGSYQFLDADGRVLYVGKAKSLRHRLPTTGRIPSALPARTAQMVAQAERVEWVVVQTEVEALMLEHSLIQAHQPRFNVRLKDDKSYPWLAVTVSRRVAPTGGGAGSEAPRGALLRPLRPRAGAARDARPAAAQLPDPDLLGQPSSAATSGSGGRASSSTSSAARGPASARWTTSSTVMVEDLMRFLAGETAPVIRRPRVRDARGGRRPRVRAGRPAARPADGGAQGGRDASRWCPSARRTST